MPNTRPKQPGTRSVGAFCAVYGCSNYLGKTRDLGISYHLFPRDPALRKNWIKKCRRADQWNPAKSYICSDHFLPDDFKRDFKAELMQCRKINQLIPGAVPSRNLPQSRTTKSVSSDLEVARRSRKMIDKTLEEDIEECEVPELCVMSRVHSTTGSHRISLIEIHTSESDLYDKVASQVVYGEIVVPESPVSETEIGEEDDFILETDIGRLTHVKKEKDDEIILLERPSTLSLEIK